MITVYFLPVEIISGTEQVLGIDLIHDALLETTPDPLIRKLIMDTTAAEDASLTPLATETRYPTPDEIDQYNAQVIITPPGPDTLRAQEILASSPDVITQPEMWELMRIFGRRLGYRF